jgi:hypothetical protein
MASILGSCCWNLSPLTLANMDPIHKMPLPNRIQAPTSVLPGKRWPIKAITSYKSLYL